MGNFTFNVPSLGTKFIDYRNQILGDSFNWSFVRPMSQVQYLVIHHAAGPDNQTPDQIAAYHVNSRGWGGIGYHFVIAQDGKTYYVGDLTTGRAHVLNLNHLAIGICLIGSFIDGKEPKDAQLNSTHELCAQLLFRTPELPNTNGWEDAVGHKDLGATRCPGDTWPNWRQKVITSATPQPDTNQRVQQITNLYQVILGRDPDQSGLQFWVNNNLSIEEIRKRITESQEHKEIINRAKKNASIQSLAQEALLRVTEARGKIEEITRL